MADSLPQLIKRLLAETVVQVRQRLGRQIAARLRAKLRRASGTFPALAAWTNTVPVDPDALLGILDLDEIHPALGTEASMRYGYAEHYNRLANDVLFDAGNGHAIPCFRQKDSITFESGGSILVRSIVRSVSKTGGFTKHLPTSRTPDASKFLVGLDIPALELLTFKSGHGHLDGPDRLYMYAVFAANIGTSFYRGRRAPSRIIKVQCDRTRRRARLVTLVDGTRSSRVEGYYLKTHGYPLAVQELHVDFAAGANAVLAAPFPLP